MAPPLDCSHSVLSTLQLLNSSGNQDQCYYNFKCAYPLGVLSAFNNIWSNVGYVILGFFFLAVVFFRNRMYTKRRRGSANIVDVSCLIFLLLYHSFIQTHGVPQYFGIYYAMGIALIIEGFMSSFYHICPTNANFQFGESVSIACHANAITQPTVLCPHRYGIHVHHWRPVPGEGVPEQTPRHPFQRFPCILLLCCSYILHTVWPGKSILRLYGIIMCACQYVLLYSRSISHCLPSSSVL